MYRVRTQDALEYFNNINEMMTFVESLPPNTCTVERLNAGVFEDVTFAAQETANVVNRYAFAEMIRFELQDLEEYNCTAFT